MFAAMRQELEEWEEEEAQKLTDEDDLGQGVVVHRGGTLATSEGKLFDKKGRLLAHGTETCLIFDAASRQAA